MEVTESSSRSSLSSTTGDNFEIYSLVWLDSLADSTHKNIDVYQKFRSTVNYLKVFDDPDECEQFIRSMVNYDRVIVVLNDKYAFDIITRVHELRHVTSIYIYSTDDNQNCEWTDLYNKIKLISADFDDIVNHIKLDYARFKMLEEPLVINIYDTNQPVERLVSNSNTEFLHSQLLIYFLMNIKLSDEQIADNKKELIDICKTVYHENLNQMKILNEFEHNYVSSNALWWYTFDSFLYQFVNKSLITSNVDLLYLLQFFINDLVSQLNADRSRSIDRVYRGYLMTGDELELFEKSVGKYVSINTFFSTYINRNHALNDLHDSQYESNNLGKVLFKIDIDPRLILTKPFANITIHSQATDKEEILFSFGSIFRIDHIHLNNSGLHVISLILCSDDDYHLKPVFDYIKHEYEEDKINLLSLGNALKRTGRLDEAEKCYQRLINDSTYNQVFISRSYHYLGRVAEAKGDYDTSLECLYKSLDIKLKILKQNDPKIAQTHNCIGIAYQQKCDHEKALEAFHKALTIWKHAYGRNHPNVAGCYNNMGVVYKKDKQYLEALKCFQKALDIHTRYPSAGDYDLAGLHNNIGAVYERLGHHAHALDHYTLSLKIKSKTLPPQHLSMGSTFENMGYVYENIGAYAQSLSYLEKAAMIYRNSFTPKHHVIMQIEESIQRVSSKL